MRLFFSSLILALAINTLGSVTPFSVIMGGSGGTSVGASVGTLVVDAFADFFSAQPLRLAHALPAEQGFQPDLTAQTPPTIPAESSLSAEQLSQGFLVAQTTMPLSSQPTRSRLGGQTITLLTIEPASGQTTTFYRLLPEFLQKISPNSLVLEPVPGLGGATAWHTLQRRRADGSQMTALTFPAFLLKPLANEHYFSQNLTTPICVLASAPMGIWVSDTSPIHDVPALLDAIKIKGNQAYMAGVGSFTAHHMANFLFNQAAGVTTDYLPYLGSAESSYAVQEGQAIAAWASATHHSLMPGMRLIAVASLERSPIYPTTPTLHESGVIMDMSEQYGLGLPAKTPEETKQVASDLFIQIVTNEAFVNKAYAMGFSITPAPYKNMENLVEQQKETLKKFLEHFLFMSF